MKLQHQGKTNMLDLIGQEITGNRFEVLENPERLLSVHEDPVLVEYRIGRDTMEARLGVDLEVKDGRIIAGHTALPNGDYDWQEVKASRTAFEPAHVREVQGFGFAAINEISPVRGSISLLREAIVDDDFITPLRATNGMFDATRGALTELENRQFEHITQGLIEVNGIIIRQPTEDQLVLVQHELSLAVYFGAHFERFGTSGQMAVFGKEALAWSDDKTPQSYAKWQHFTAKIAPDRGRFTDRTDWCPGAKTMTPLQADETTIQGPNGRIDVLPIEALVNDAGQIASPYSLLKA